jgi:hypothetical protein
MSVAPFDLPGICATMNGTGDVGGAEMLAVAVAA